MAGEGKEHFCPPSGFTATQATMYRKFKVMDASQTPLARNSDVYSALTEGKSAIFAAAI